MMVPPFDVRSIPVVLKVGLSLGITLALFHTLDFGLRPPNTELLAFSLEVLREIAVGMIIGITVKFLFAGVMMAGEVVGTQMGFGLARQVDPLQGRELSVIAQLKNLTAMLFFLVTNSHHYFLHAIAESFRLVPPFEFRLQAPLMERLIDLSCELFLIALKVGAPVIAALLFTSVALALAARTVPQMNVFIVAFPVKIMVGLLFLMLSMPFLASFLRKLFEDMAGNLFVLLRMM
jgi:flagellar biosynthetic protein FliR